MKRIIIGVIAGMLVAGGAVAYATIPDSGGAIHGCYDTGGNLKVIDTATATCPKGYTPLTWDQTGPPGTKGDAGAPGPAAVTKSGLVPQNDCVVPASGGANCVDLSQAWNAPFNGRCRVEVFAQIPNGMTGVLDDGPPVDLETWGSSAGFGRIGPWRYFIANGTASASTEVSFSTVDIIQQGSGYNFGVTLGDNPSADWAGKDITYFGDYFCWSS